MNYRTAFFLMLVTLSYSASIRSQSLQAEHRQNAATEDSTPQQQSQSQINQERPQEVRPDDTLKIDTALINVPVRVMDRVGRFVPNLSRDDFRLYEDGVRQQISFFNPMEAPFTVVLLIDTSPSTESNHDQIKRAAISFIDQLRPEDNVMVVTFNGSIKVLSKATKDREVLRKAVRRISWDGSGTLLYGTVETLLTRFFNRMHGRKALVMLTDGEDFDMRVDSESTVLWKRKLSGDGSKLTLTGFPPCKVIPCVTAERNLHDAEEADVLVYPIQFIEPIEADAGSDGKVSEVALEFRRIADAYLNGLAERTGGRFFHADDPQQLGPIFNSIAEELRYQYSLGYYPMNRAETGERRTIKVEVNRVNVAVRARNSYIYGAPDHPH